MSGRVGRRSVLDPPVLILTLSLQAGVLFQYTAQKQVISFFMRNIFVLVSRG